MHRNQEEISKILLREKAELIKALSSPVRLCILKRLIENGRLNVTEITNCMDVTQSGVSQHLAKLRSLGIVRCEKVENQVFYTCEREDIKKILLAVFSD